MQKVHYQGLRRSKNVSLHFVNDHFESKRNADSGLYGQTLISLLTSFLLQAKYQHSPAAPCHFHQGLYLEVSCLRYY